MILTIAILSSALCALAAWAIWPVLRTDMDRAVDMTAVSILATASALFVGIATTLAALS